MEYERSLGFSNEVLVRRDLVVQDHIHHMTSLMNNLKCVPDSHHDLLMQHLELMNTKIRQMLCEGFKASSIRKERQQAENVTLNCEASGST